MRKWRQIPCAIYIAFSPDAQSVRKTLMTVLDRLSHLPPHNIDLGIVELVLAEVLNNIVEHAYALNQKGLIQVRVTATHHVLWFEVQDNGRPMSNEILPIGERPNVDTEPAALPEGGFGWFLIKSLARGLCYQRIADQNHLRFHFTSEAAAQVPDRHAVKLAN